MTAAAAAGSEPQGAHHAEQDDEAPLGDAAWQLAAALCQRDDPSGRETRATPRPPGPHVHTHVLDIPRQVRPCPGGPLSTAEKIYFLVWSPLDICTAVQLGARAVRDKTRGYALLRKHQAVIPAAQKKLTPTSTVTE